MGLLPLPENAILALGPSGLEFGPPGVDRESPLLMHTTLTIAPGV